MARSRLYPVIAICLALASISAAYAKEEILGVWGDETRSVVLSLEGRNYFLRNDSGKTGPYQYVSLVKFNTKEDVSTSFDVVEGGQTFVLGLGGEKLGPYIDIVTFLGGKVRCAKKTDGVRDIIFDDGVELRVVGRTMNKPYEAGVSPDGKHAYVYSRSESGVDCLNLDGYETIIAFSKVSSAKVLGFFGTPARLWVLSPMRDGYYLFLITPSPNGSVPKIDALHGTLKNGSCIQSFMKGTSLEESVIQSLLTSSSERPLELRLPSWRKIQKNGVCALRFMDSLDTEYVFNGQDLMTVSKRETYDPQKRQMSVSADGKTIVTVGGLNDERNGSRTTIVRKNGQIVSSHPASRIAQVEMIAGTASCAYVVLGRGRTREFWLDGKLVASSDEGGIFTDAKVYSEDTYGESVRTNYAGYYQVVKDGTTTLWQFGRPDPVAGPFPGEGTYYNFDGAHPAWPLVYRRDQNSSVTKKLEEEHQLYVGGAPSEPRRQIGDPVFSEDGSVYSYRWAPDYGMSYSVRTGSKDSGPYAILGAIMYLHGSREPAYVFGNGSSVKFGSPTGASVALPNYSNNNRIPGVCYLEISPDGKAIQYQRIIGAYPSADSKKKNDFQGATLVVDGKPYVGHYYPDKRMALYLDPSTGNVIRETR
jgi:hypothetical protein